MRDRPEVDPDRIGLLAVSQGTWVASVVGAADARLAFLVQIAGPAVSPVEADTYAVKHGWRRAGLAADELQTAEQLWHLEVAAIRSAPESAAWRRYLSAVESARRQRWYPKADYSPSQPTGWFTGWYRLVSDHQPAAAIAATRAASLWVYGASDSESDVAVNAAILRDLAVRATGAIEVACFADAGHGLNVPVDRAEDALPSTVAPGFFELVDDWIARRADLPAPADGGLAALLDRSAVTGCPAVEPVRRPSRR
jgi:hypothetical protein